MMPGGSGLRVLCEPLGGEAEAFLEGGRDPDAELALETACGDARAALLSGHGRTMDRCEW